MGWATGHIQNLKAGRTIQCRPRGNSMQGKIDSGDLVTIAPLGETPKPGDIVLCKVHGCEYLHLVKAVQGDRFQIGNNKGRINGWIGRSSIFGIAVSIEKASR